MALVSALLEIFQRPSIADVLRELVLFIIPLWIAVIVGVLVGWAWKPKWVSLVGRDISDCSASKHDSSSSVASCFAAIPSLNSFKLPLPCWSAAAANDKDTLPPPAVHSDGSRFVPFFFSVGFYKVRIFFFCLLHKVWKFVDFQSPICDVGVTYNF